MVLNNVVEAMQAIATSCTPVERPLSPHYPFQTTGPGPTYFSSPLDLAISKETQRPAYRISRIDLLLTL